LTAALCSIIFFTISCKKAAKNSPTAPDVETATPAMTVTATFPEETFTPGITGTATQTATAGDTGTYTRTWTITQSATITGTATITQTGTITETATETSTVTETGTITETATITQTSTITATYTDTPLPGTADDPYEPDDSIAEAKSITTDGVLQYHNFYTDGSNHDFLYFSASAGSRYIISAAVLYPAAMNIIDVSLRDSAGSLLTFFSNNYLDAGSDTASYVFNCNTTGTYYLEIKNDNNIKGKDSGYNVDIKELGAIMPTDLGTAVDNSSVVFTQGGDAAWFGQSNISHDGDGAAQSGFIANSRTSSMSITVSSGAHVSFYWKVSSEYEYDFLNFYADGDEIDQITGETDWEQYSYTAPSDGNTHELKWEYLKDISFSGGYDAGWVDDLTVTY
jgi:hypothetical protein